MQYVFSDRMKDMGGNAIREIFKLLSRPDMISFAGGFPTASLLPVKEVGEIAVDLLRGEKGVEILQYGATEGYAPLRERIASFVSRYGIVGMKSDNVRIVSGGQQTIDLMCKCFVNAGDAVLVEDPGSQDSQTQTQAALLRAHFFQSHRQDVFSACAQRDSAHHRKTRRHGA